MNSKGYLDKAPHMLISSQYGSEEHIYRDRAEELVRDLIVDLEAAEKEIERLESAIGLRLGKANPIDAMRVKNDFDAYLEKRKTEKGHDD